MSRASYGADVYSPIRGNASFHDTLSDDTESDFLDLWHEPYGAAGKNRNSEEKEKKPYIPFLCKDEAPSMDKIPDNLQSIDKTDSIAEKKNKKDSSLEADFTRISYITTRSKSTHKSKKELGVIQESQLTQNGTVSKTRKKNYVTARPEVNLNKELPPSKTKQNKHSSSSLAISADSNKEISPSKIKQNKDSVSSLAIFADSNKDLPPSKIKKNKNLASSLISSDLNKELLPSKNTQNNDSLALSLTSLSEEQPKKSPVFNVHIDSMKSDHNYPGSSDEQVQTRKVLSKSNVVLKKNHSKSKKLGKDFKISTKKCTEIEKPVFPFDCKMNNLRLPDELSLDKENQGESVMSDNPKADSTLISSVSKPEEIQANIIEKLVRDAVSFEFDGIRQMLYLHQLQLLKHMDHNLAYHELQKTNEKLVEENRKLKNIIAHHKT